MNTESDNYMSAFDAALDAIRAQDADALDRAHTEMRFAAEAMRETPQSNGEPS